MAWRLAKSLETLRSQINMGYPNRSKISDGTIGDAAHSKRKSDHNPDRDGTVDGMDITHDPVNGPDIADLATALIASRDRRVSYIIANGQIIAGRKGPKPWVRRQYNGANKHTKHIHISVLDENQDDTTPWNLTAMSAPKVEPKQSVLKKGSKGPFVTELQANLNSLGYAVGEADGVFGERTETAVKAFQKARGLTVDGWAGPRTLDAIGKALAEKAAKPKIEKAEKTVPPTADNAVKRETSWFGKVAGWLTAGGVAASGAVSSVFEADWTTVLAVAGGVVLVGGAVVGGFLLLGSRVAAKFDEINKRAE